MASFAGREWIYEYRTIDNLIFSDTEVSRQKIDRIFARYSSLTRAWSIELNSQWVVRVYCAVKLILYTSLLFNSSEFCKKSNARVAVPYLNYYAIFTASRALALLIPEASWDGGDLLNISHKKVRVVIRDFINMFDAGLASKYGVLFDVLRAEREMISYRVPISGDRVLKGAEIEDITQMLIVLAELAQMCSEILEISVAKKAKEDSLVFDLADMDFVFKNELFGNEYIDHDDIYRSGYLQRKMPYPLNIYITATEGMVEDFFGSWCRDEVSVEGVQFDPDEDWRTIFSFQ